MDLCIEEYDNGEDIVELLTLVFHGWPDYNIKCTPLEHWNWKYLENPIHKGFISVCKAEDKIVGCFHTIPMKIKIGYSEYLSVTATDVAVHPDYRRRGIYNKLYTGILSMQRKENVKYHFGVSNNPILLKDNIKKGLIPFPREIYFYIKLYDMKLHLRNVKKVTNAQIYGYYLLNTLNKINNSLVSKKDTRKSIKISQISLFDSEINHFWNQIKDEYNYIVVRTKDYLNWRFCHTNSPDYKIFIAEEGGDILGYAVLKINTKHPGYPLGYVVDLITIKNDADAQQALISKLLAIFKESNVNFIYWPLIHNHPLTKIANRNGFLNSRTLIHYVYTPELCEIGKDETVFHKSIPNDVHFSYGDYDWA